MKKSWILVGVLLLAGMGGGVWWAMSRSASKSIPVSTTLPDARKFDAAILGTFNGSTADQGGPVEGGVATSQNYVLVSSPTGIPKHVDPFAMETSVPASTRLNVPYVPNYPQGITSQRADAMSMEAALLMADGYYRGVSGILTEEVAARAFARLSETEKSVTSTPLIPSARDTADLMIHAMQVQDIVVAPLRDIGQIHRALAMGFPVIVPVSGLARSQIYHAVIVIGFVDGSVIVHDPTVVDGANILIRNEELLNAAHDWNGGDVAHGAPVVLVEIPRL
jgi:hypothetical protein